MAHGYDLQRMRHIHACVSSEWLSLQAQALVFWRIFYVFVSLCLCCLTKIDKIMLFGEGNCLGGVDTSYLYKSFSFRLSRATSGLRDFFNP